MTGPEPAGQHRTTLLALWLASRSASAGQVLDVACQPGGACAGDRGLTRSRRDGRGDQAGLVGHDDQLGAVPGVQLGHDAAYVGLGGERAQEQPGGDFVVGQALGGQRHHLALPVGQACQRDAARRGPFGAAGDVGDQPAGHAGRQQRVAAGHHPDGLDQLGRLGVLDQETAGPGAQRLVDVLVGLEGGQDDDLDPGQVLLGRDAPGGFQAVDPGHPDVHQHHVRALAAGQVHGLPAVGGLTDHLQVLGGVDQDPEPGPDQGLVIGEQHPDHGRTPWAGEAAWPVSVPWTGRRAVTWKPPPGRGPACTAPPAAAARSRIPARP